MAGEEEEEACQGREEKRREVFPSTCYFTTPYGTILDFPPKFAEKTNEEGKRTIFLRIRERAGNTIDFSSAFLRKM